MAIMSVNINFKKSSWKNRQWVPVQLSPEFHNLQYYPIVITKGISEQQTRNTYVTYREYLQLLEVDNTLPAWFLSKSAQLLFTLQYKNNVFQSTFNGWSTLKLSTGHRYTKINMKSYYNLNLEDGAYRLLVRLYLRTKPSNTESAKLRKVLEQYITNITSKVQLITFLIENEDKHIILQSCKQLSTVKYVVFEKLKKL